MLTIKNNPAIVKINSVRLKAVLAQIPKSVVMLKVPVSMLSLTGQQVINEKSPREVAVLTQGFRQMRSNRHRRGDPGMRFVADEIQVLKTKAQQARKTI